MYYCNNCGYMIPSNEYTDEILDGEGVILCSEECAQEASYWKKYVIPLEVKIATELAK